MTVCIKDSSTYMHIYTTKTERYFSILGTAWFLLILNNTTSHRYTVLLQSVGCQSTPSNNPTEFACKRHTFCPSLADRERERVVIIPPISPPLTKRSKWPLRYGDTTTTTRQKKVKIINDADNLAHFCQNGAQPALKEKTNIYAHCILRYCVLHTILHNRELCLGSRAQESGLRRRHRRRYAHWENRNKAKGERLSLSSSTKPKWSLAS